MSAESMPTMPGIHHITAICGDPQPNVDFYSGLLGLRLVKKTVNFDDPSSYHLYYGDGLGSPGTIMTFFAWTNLPPLSSGKGSAGTGQVTTVAFTIPEDSLDFWIDRLAAEAIDFDGPFPRFNERLLRLKDPDGITVELVTRPDVTPREAWQEGPVPVEHAITGFHGVSACLAGYEKTARLLLDELPFREVGHEGNRFRFSVGEGQDEAFFDIKVEPDARRGRMGIGSVHHIAWRTPTREEEEKWRRHLANAGFNVTPVLDRNYFESVYFREPGGVLFEIATDEPGFAIDEITSELGTHLMLPPWLEAKRERLMQRLPEIRLPKVSRPSMSNGEAGDAR